MSASKLNSEKDAKLKVEEIVGFENRVTRDAVKLRSFERRKWQQKKGREDRPVCMLIRIYGCRNVFKGDQEVSLECLPNAITARSLSEKVLPI